MRTTLQTIGTLALVLGLGLGSATNASAETFDEAAKAAKPIHSVSNLAALFWSKDASCGKMKSDLLRRQCEGVQRARIGSLAGETFVIDVAGAAIDVKANAKKNSVEVTLRSCIACEAEGLLVVGKGAHQVSGNTLLAAPVKSSTKSFKDAARAEHWGKYIATRLRAQFLVKVPANLDRFKVAGREGYKVEVVGYRLYDPCQGNVLDASPASKRGPVEDATCKDEPKFAEAPKEEPKAEDLQPDRLNTSQIKTAMKEVSKLTDACHDAYRIGGTATFKLVISGSGKLLKAEQSGDFEGTPTGICLDKAMQSASFPTSKKKETPISYPIVLQ